MLTSRCVISNLCVATIEKDTKPYLIPTLSLEVLCDGTFNTFIIYRVNCFMAGIPQSPFGGFKMSGQGREW